MVKNFEIIVLRVYENVISCFEQCFLEFNNNYRPAPIAIYAKDELLRNNLR